ncbi:uncharacterized protein VTP21DRAFT_10540 [Calcarisporiella thermophila]|uniref:uncharacterized protein n=1 Tax=Calcarisporiella thermophila TaxID=911321 RepID=UPI0037436434
MAEESKSTIMNAQNGQGSNLEDESSALQSSGTGATKQSFDDKPLIPLVDDEDDGLTVQCEEALVEIFNRYDKDKDGSLNKQELDAFATDTNGCSFDQDTLDEINDFLDVTEEGHLTLQGFLQMYHLQTSNDPMETWKDLKTHGYDENLRLVLSRREDVDEEKVKEAARFSIEKMKEAEKEEREAREKERTTRRKSQETVSSS